MLKDYFKLGLTNFIRRGIRSWLTLLGIFIGIAAVVSLISLGAGLKLAVASQFNILGAERITIQAKGVQAGPPGTNVASPLTIQDLKTVQKANGVAVAAGQLIQTATVLFDRKIQLTYIGTLPKDAKERAWIQEIGNDEIEYGRELRSTDKYDIVVGNDYHTKKTLGRNIELGDKINIQGRDFEVVGILAKKGSFTTDGVIVMNEDITREIYNIPNTYSLLYAKADNADTINQTVDNIKRELDKERGLKQGKEDFTLQTNVQAMQSINQTLDIVTTLLIGIAAISLIVGGIGIMNTMYTSVLERQQEIGIMKAIGARNRDIFAIFFIESGMLGLAGGSIGVIIGVGIGKLIELVGTVVLGTNLLQASFSPELIIGSLIFAFVVGTLAGTLPALGAAKMSPVDALKD